MMTITNAAAEVIREWLRASSDLCHPVVYLGQSSNTPAEVTEALKRGASRKELEEITQRTLKSEPRHLCPLVYPSSHFIWLTTTINGFRFASRLFYPSAVRRAMKNGVLDAAERGLVLKDADGTAVLPTNATGAL
jgi:hypothetical protein